MGGRVGEGGEGGGGEGRLTGRSPTLTSRPRAATSVATSTHASPERKSRNAFSRSDWSRSPCIVTCAILRLCSVRATAAREGRIEDTWR